MTNGLIEPPEQGVYPDVPMDTYHRWDAASSSQLNKLSKSPAHLRAYRDEEYEETEALSLGRIIHKAVLEPELFEEQFTVLGQCEATKGDGERCSYSAKYVTPDHEHLCGTHGSEDQQDESVKTVKEDHMETARGIIDSIEQSDSAKAMLRGAGESEYSYTWVDPKTGVKCKARMDRYSPEVPGGAIVDLKTTRDASPDRFRKDIFNYTYYLQAALYLRGAQALDRDLDHFVIVAVEKKPPYGVQVYRISDALTKEVKGQLNDLLYLYSACMENDEWPGYPDEIRDISVPSWAHDKIEDQRNEIVNHIRRIEQ